MLENKDPPSQNPKRPSLLVPHSYLNTGAIPKRKSNFSDEQKPKVEQNLERQHESKPVKVNFRYTKWDYDMALHQTYLNLKKEFPENSGVDNFELAKALVKLPINEPLNQKNEFSLTELSDHATQTTSMNCKNFGMQTEENLFADRKNFGSQTENLCPNATIVNIVRTVSQDFDKLEYTKISLECFLYKKNFVRLFHENQRLVDHIKILESHFQSTDPGRIRILRSLTSTLIQNNDEMVDEMSHLIERMNSLQFKIFFF